VTAIASVRTFVEAIPLARPYTITFRTVSAIAPVIVVLRDGRGRLGLGAASPEPHVTGETNQACQAALAEGALDWLVGADVRTLPALARRLAATMPATPAARAAVDMALYDLLGQTLELPVCELLGRAHTAMPTSITIGIKPTDEALREADEYLGRGFRILKIKIGRALDEDIERVRALRARVGPDVILRVDANQGYTLDGTRAFLAATESLQLELIEQPVAAAQTRSLLALEEAARAHLVADERVRSPQDALALANVPRPCELFNIKLMKAGGITPARAIADIADIAGMGLMWGCMDESCISIAAALHAAFASPATRALDLDGSFDLARDVASGGFVVEGGVMRLAGGPGLGVTLQDQLLARG
jgi:L-alanine-DL-glutamate epimerase-like enolase superfamily enzyme